MAMKLRTRIDVIRARLADYFRFYNEERLHETLGYRTLHEAYFGTAPELAAAAGVV